MVGTRGENLYCVVLEAPYKCISENKANKCKNGIIFKKRLKSNIFHFNEKVLMEAKKNKIRSLEEVLLVFERCLQFWQ